MRHVGRAVSVALVLVSAWGCGGGPSELALEAPDGSVVDDATGTGGDAAEDGGFVLDTSGCVPKTCTDLGVNCGPAADGCGGIIESCGTCTAPEFCGGGGASKCGAGDAGSCTPKTCTELGAKCGKQGDGCGSLIDCGTCVAPETCGGGGVPNVCGMGGPGPDGGACVPKTCAAMGFDCGPVADGCGGLVTCGTCASGTICGVAGKPNVCGVPPPAPCAKKTCADVGANCGPVSDGCGGLTASCGTCSGTETCGGGGVPSKCGGPPACVKKTCADYPGTCGQQPDGCGGLTVSCGSCTLPDTCGGGGVPSKCGGAPVCVKKTCADYPGTCGAQSDGCGGLTASCGTCTSPQTCGGGGVPNKCGAPPPCVPKTCADYPGTCGPQIDGCGGVTASCGTCTSPAFCGGGGPGKCGTGGTTTCINLQCKQTTCTGTATTSISGVVYDPAGLRPLPNVNVYVPNAAVAPLTSGASCDGCSAGLSGMPLVQTVTDIRGRFKLVNMPVDANVPVVIQVGKWRRQIKVTTAKCVDTVVPAGLTRLPRNKTEGDIPKIALVTGGADALECLLRKVGIDDSEFTGPAGTGRVNLYAGAGGGTSSYSAGGAFPTATQLWSSLDPNTVVTPQIYGLRRYDVVLLSCEASEATGNKTNAALKAMQDYVNAGGRVFGSHYHYTWMRRSSGLAAPYNNWATMVSWNTSLVTLANDTPETVLTTFPKALTMNQWMQVTPPPPAVPWATVVPPAASPSRFPVDGGRRSINAINDKTNTLTWIQTVSGNYPQYFSFDTPVGAAAGKACGRFVFSDLHVASGDDPGGTFPANDCTTPKTSMSPQEGALEFMFFDLASPVCGGTTPPPTCTPTTCAAQGIECGTAPDGCGGTLSCGTCTAPAVCSTGGKCSTSSCVPTTCTALGYECGSWADGCGGTLNCGPCAAGTCGGGGVPGKCGGPSCTATTCAALGYDCGSWPDGCGGTLTCGTCTPPASCGGSGVAGKCGAPTCTPKTCLGLGYECGSWADGCGGVLSCGVCTPPATCGASTPGKCDVSTCTPKSCADMGVKCGPSGDGCGGTIDCGACPPGGGCTPLTCGGRCGPQGDGCGGVLTCPACPGGTCVPTTCAAAGAECGLYPDGCGKLLDCGTCVAPKTCGGGGVPNKCGGVM
ncbi:MAG: hypothetical protein HYV09_11095 [Deltaproteobacteria bacterium]|nr:hypothetical protein [Deltaproteobacteria bacterium]